MAAKKRKNKAGTKKIEPETGEPDVNPQDEKTTGRPCICIKTDEGWFCMKQMPNGSLKECDGPFGTREECEEHTCG